MRYLGLLLFLLFTMSNCGNIEDTYKDMAGDGPIRYIGTCSDVELTPKWKSIEVSWKNHIDPLITNIKVTWENNNVVKDTLLEKGVTGIVLKDLTTGNYKISVQNVDKHGNLSNAEVLFMRPFTEDHEIVKTFPRVVTKHFFVKNRLVLFFSKWSDDIEEVSIRYMNEEGEEKIHLLSQQDIESKYYLLEETIKQGQTIYLHRKGYIADCEDMIAFDPIPLKRELALTTDFKKEVARNVNGQELTLEVVDAIETLNLNYSLNSFEDLLYFQNLKVLNLAKGRYQYDIPTDYYKSDSKITDKEVSIFTLNVLHEVLGVEINKYNLHYDLGLDEELPFIIMHDNPVPPVRNYIDLTNKTIECSPEDENEYESDLMTLFDNRVKDSWLPEGSAVHRTHEIIIDLGEMTSLTGLHIGQDDGIIRGESKYKPKVITLQLSTNKATWYNATHEEEITIGSTPAEITEILFSRQEPVRYVKLKVNDILYSKTYRVTLSMFSLF